MDEIDRELKQIKLQRERLALQRELAQRALKANTIGLVGGASTRAAGALGTTRRFGVRLLSRWWKLAALLAVMLPLVYGGLEWKQRSDQAKLNAELEQFVALKCKKERRAYDECSASAISARDRGICGGLQGASLFCEANAMDAFLAQKKAESSR